MNPEGLNLAGGYLQPLPGAATVEQLTAALNGVINTLNQQLQTQVFSDGTNKRFLYGYQATGWPGGNFGLKISLPGFDVTTATNAQLLFSWDFTTGNQWRYGGDEYIYGGTNFWYDPASVKNYMQEGILPDGTGGWVVADVGNDVSDGF